MNNNQEKKTFVHKKRKRFKKVSKEKKNKFKNLNLYKNYMNFFSFCWENKEIKKQINNLGIFFNANIFWFLIKLQYFNQPSNFQSNFEELFKKIEDKKKIINNNNFTTENNLIFEEEFLNSKLNQLHQINQSRISKINTKIKQEFEHKQKFLNLEEYYNKIYNEKFPNLNNNSNNNNFYSNEIFPNLKNYYRQFYFDLSKKDKTKCMICNDGEVDLNQILFKCVSCQILVHQNCYGISQNEQNSWVCNLCKLEEDKKKEIKCTHWVCDLCKKFPDDEKRKEIKCILCSKNGGAMKQIELPSNSYFAKTLEDCRNNDKKPPEFNLKIIIPFEDYDKMTCELCWVHLNCAIWNKDIEIKNMNEIKKIKCFDQIGFDKFFGKNICNLCKNNYGFLLKCKEKSCKKYFHIECARINDYFLEVEEENKEIKYYVYCLEHRPNVLNKKKKKFENEIQKEVKEFNNYLFEVFEKLKKKNIKIFDDDFLSFNNNNNENFDNNFNKKNYYYNKKIFNNKKNFIRKFSKKKK